MRTVLLAAIAAIATGGAWWLWGQSDAARPAEEGQALVAVTLPATLSPEAQAGQQAFAANCASCHGTDAELPVPEGVLGLECEFAFRLARPLPPRPLPYTPEEVVGAVGSVHPAIELVGLCLPPEAFRDVRWCIADHALDVAFVAGAAIPDWHGLDLPALSVRCVINGKEVAVGNGAAVLGNPVTALTWLANALSRRGRGLLADDWISTGTCTGIQAVRPGDVVEAVFGGTGSVRVAFTGA